jgi:hypothetical protein
MSGVSPRHPSRLVLTITLAALASLSLVGCGKDNKITNPTPTGPTSYTGIVAGATTSGTLGITLGATAAAARVGFRAQAIVAASGVFTPAGGTALLLTGTYDNVAKTFSISGSGWTFSGKLTTYGIEGTFLGPAGVSGSFNLQPGTDGVIVFLGTWASEVKTHHGYFNFSISGSTAYGYGANESGGVPTTLVGSYNSSTKVINFQHPLNPTGPPLVTGTHDEVNGTAGGTWDDQDGDHGVWSAVRQP